jgi:hypothetical protein
VLSWSSDEAYVGGRGRAVGLHLWRRPLQHQLSAGARDREHRPVRVDAPHRRSRLEPELTNRIEEALVAMPADAVSQQHQPAAAPVLAPAGCRHRALHEPTLLARARCGHCCAQGRSARTAEGGYILPTPQTRMSRRSARESLLNSRPPQPAVRCAGRHAASLASKGLQHTPSSAWASE